MNEFMNFKDMWILAQHHWLWMLLALAIGGWVGFRYNTPDKHKH